MFWKAAAKRLRNIRSGMSKRGQHPVMDAVRFWAICARRHACVCVAIENTNKYWGSFHEVGFLRLNFKLVHRNDVRARG